MAAQDLERTSPLSADTKRFENAMRKAQGITSKRLHTWPDIISQPIDPFAVTHDDGATFDDGSTYAA